MTETLWHLQQVDLAGADAPRLAEVTLKIRHGITAVIGTSGAGKTSLLNLLVGFERPNAGRCDSNVASRNGRLPLFWSPQDGGLWSHLTVRQHLDRVAADADKAQHLLQRFDLAPRAQAYPQELSQGERARLSVARALATAAKVLVMDEPLAHVDPQRIGSYWQVILDEVAAIQAGLVFATHSPRSVLAHAQRVVYVEHGRVLYEGPVDDLYWRPANEELARSLGECNWLGPTEAKLWLGDSPAEPRCYRPQQLAVEPDETGACRVESASFQGDIAHATLRHDGNGACRGFYHRPTTQRLCAGMRVALKLVPCLLILALLAGCGGGADPLLNVRQVRRWTLPAEGKRIPAPRSVSVDGDDRAIVVDNAGRVLILDAQGDLIDTWHLPTNEAGNAEGTCVLADGRIAVADTHYSRIVMFDQQGEVESTFGERGTEPGQFIYAADVAQDEDGNLYVSEYGGNDRVQKFTLEGELLHAFGSIGSGPGQFQRAMGMVYHRGTLYVADAGNHRVQAFSKAGEFLGVVGSTKQPLKLHFPYDVCAAGDGLYVVEYGAGRVTAVGLDGILRGRFGTSGRGDGQFYTPWGLAIDSKGHLRVADTGNQRIVELSL